MEGQTSVSAPVVRVGSLVRAVNPADKSERVRLSYETSEHILDRILEDDAIIVGRLREFIDGQSCIGAQCKPSSSLPNNQVASKLRLAPSTRSSDFSTGVDLSDLLISLDEFTVVLRPCFTVCVDDDSYGLVSSKPIDVYSKVWTRFLLVGDAHGIERIWTNKQADQFFDCVRAISDKIQSFGEQIYSEYVSQAINGKIEVRLEHRLTAASYGVSDSAFNSVLSTLDKPTNLAISDPKGWDGKPEDISPETQIGMLTGVARKFFSTGIESDKPSIKAVIDQLRTDSEEQEKAAAFRVVAVDDGVRNRAIYVAEIGEMDSYFVGIAADKDVEYVLSRPSSYREGDNSLMGDLKINASDVPANNTSTILALEIASHL